MNSMKHGFTVAVTGASGFLGRELLKQLLNEDSINVIAITSRKKILEDLSKYTNIKILHSSNWVKTIDTNVDVLINCAFPRTSDPRQLAKGILYTENLVKSAKQLNVKSIINISSQSVYSQKEKRVIDENSIISPETLYGMTKYACERIVSNLCEEYKITYSNIRLASLMGVDLEVRMTNRFVNAVLNNETIVVHGGNQKISYLDVRDAAAALVNMVNVPSNKWKEVYNLGDNGYFTILELVENIESAAKDYTSNKVNVEIIKGSNDFNNLIKSDLFYNDFNWKPKFDMPLVVDELFQHYNNKVTGDDYTCIP